jgi:glycerol kinase
VLRVDGGMVAFDWTMQGGSLGAPDDRPTIMDLAGLQSGLYPDSPAFAARWALDRRFTAAMDEATRSRKIAAWKYAVHRTARTS